VASANLSLEIWVWLGSSSKALTNKMVLASCSQNPMKDWACDTRFSKSGSWSVVIFVGLFPLVLIFGEKSIAHNPEFPVEFQTVAHPDQQWLLVAIALVI